MIDKVIEGFMVRMEGLEPPCREALDPKSSASTNFATSANGVQRKQHFYLRTIFFYLFVFGRIENE